MPDTTKPVSSNHGECPMGIASRSRLACIGEKCAWFNREHSACAVLILSVAADETAANLDKIQAQLHDKL